MNQELLNTGKIILPGANRKDFLKPSNFDKKRKKFEATGKLDLEDFNSAAEIGQFLDWYNQSRSNTKRKEFDNEVLEISKFLARTLGRSSIVIDTKPKK